MELECRKVVFPDELDDVLAFDAAVFSNPGDYMSPEEWTQSDAYWMFVDKARVGCCALQDNVDYDDSTRNGALYIASIAISAEWRRHGLGTKFTKWQIEYARKRSFASIVANTRESNAAMRALYEKLGFKVRCITDYYDEPEERTVVFDLAL